MLTTTPFNTGKVLIGSRYQRPPYVESSRDMIRLQSGLIKPGKRVSANAEMDGIVIAVCTVCLALATLVMWMGS